MTTRALIILTSHGVLGDTGKQTGFYWEEMATPYWAFRDAGFEVDIASVAGGEPPADPNSASDENVTDAVRRFKDDDEAMKALKNSSAIQTVDADAYAMVFVPGGHGTMWDLKQSTAVGDVLTTAFEANKVVGAVCHGPSALLGATLSNGDPLVKGRTVNGFTDSEEKAVELDQIVPFLLEAELKRQGANFESGDNFKPHAVVDGNLVTGQNPSSSQLVAEKMLAIAAKA